MKRLFWILLTLALALGVSGGFIGSLSPTGDPGTRASPTLAGIGILFIVGGATLAACVLILAAWWQVPSRLKLKIQRERPADDVRIVQSTKSLRELVSRSREPRPLSTYVVCATNETALEVWSFGRMVISVPAASIEHVSVGSVVTSRPVPALVFSGALGTFELVPGRVGLELFPMLDVDRVRLLGATLFDRLKGS